MDETTTSAPTDSAEKVGEYYAPIDPMDAFQCESCQ